MRELDRQIKENGSKQELACGLGGGRRQLGRNRGREGWGGAAGGATRVAGVDAQALQGVRELIAQAHF